MSTRRRLSPTQIHGIELNARKLSVSCPVCERPPFAWCVLLDNGRLAQQLHTGRRP